MRKFGQYPALADKDIDQILVWINSWSDPISFTVAVPGTEVQIKHGLGYIPGSAIPAIQESTTGQGVIYPGTTPWDRTFIYLTATAAGDYSIIARR